MTTLESACEIAAIRGKLLMIQEQALMYKQVIGSQFNRTTPFFIATYMSQKRGLHSVSYTVVRPDGLPIGGGDSYAAALSDARHFLATWSPEQQSVIHAHAKGVCEDYAAKDRARREEEFKAWKRGGKVVPIAKKVPKRRQAVFDKSEGKCHYCAKALTVDGKWHIEHKMPRALLGGSEQSNLVASCVSCNLRKRDKTDLEFIAKESAAQ